MSMSVKIQPPPDPFLKRFFKQKTVSFLLLSIHSQIISVSLKCVHCPLSHSSRPLRRAWPPRPVALHAPMRPRLLTHICPFMTNKVLDSSFSLTFNTPISFFTFIFSSTRFPGAFSECVFLFHRSRFISSISYPIQDMTINVHPFLCPFLAV